MLFVLTVAGMLTVQPIDSSNMCLAAAETLNKDPKVEMAFCGYEDDGKGVIGKKKGDFDGEAAN